MDFTQNLSDTKILKFPHCVLLYDRTAKHVVRPTPKGSGIATERSAKPPEKGGNLGHIFVVKLAKSLVSNVL